MIAVMYAILLGLLCPTQGSVGNGQTTVQTTNSGDEGGVGGDVGVVRPPRPPKSN